MRILKKDRRRLNAEVVGHDHFGFDAEVVSHLFYAFDHDGWSAEVEFDFGRVGVLVEIFVVRNLMDKSSETVPVIFGERIAESNVHFKVGELFFEGTKFVHVEEFSFGSSAVPEGDFPFGSDTFKLIKNVRAHGRHSCTTADEAHFALGFLGKEFAVRSRDGNFVAGF